LVAVPFKLIEVEPSDPVDKSEAEGKIDYGCNENCGCSQSSSSGMYLHRSKFFIL